MYKPNYISMLLSTYCHLHGMIYIYFLVTPNTIIVVYILLLLLFYERRNRNFWIVEFTPSELSSASMPMIKKVKQIVEIIGQNQSESIDRLLETTTAQQHSFRAAPPSQREAHPT